MKSQWLFYRATERPSTDVSIIQKFNAYGFYVQTAVICCMQVAAVFWLFLWFRKL